MAISMKKLYKWANKDFTVLGEGDGILSPDGFRYETLFSHGIKTEESENVPNFSSRSVAITRWQAEFRKFTKNFTKISWSIRPRINKTGKRYTICARLVIS